MYSRGLKVSFFIRVIVYFVELVNKWTIFVKIINDPVFVIEYQATISQPKYEIFFFWSRLDFWSIFLAKFDWNLFNLALVPVFIGTVKKP